MSKKCLDTRDKILKEAFNEFQKKGYKLANIDTIVKKAGVTKGALYYYFKSKKELANYVIDTVVYNQLDKNFLSFISLDEQRTLPESLIKFSEKISIEEIKNGGTLIRLANELSDNHRGTQNRIKNLLDLIVNQINEKLKQDQKHKQVTNSYNTLSVDRFISASMIGALTLSKIYQDQNKFKEVINQLTTTLETVYLI